MAAATISHMTHLDFAAWLNLISTTAIVAALIFAALQVRQGNIKRRDLAAITLIQTVQSEGWTRALNLLGNLPANAELSDVLAAGSELQRALTEFGLRLETVGYLVFRRNVDLQTVDELIGGVVLTFWSRAKRWGERERERTGNPKYLEWCEWLADRILEGREKLGHRPAYSRYADWRE
jgi:hypothetical protein